MTEFHLGLSIRGALRWGDYEMRNALKWIKKDGGAVFASVSELRGEMAEMLASGIEMIPFAECDNWDDKNGCLGHEKEKQCDTSPLPLQPV